MSDKNYLAMSDEEFLKLPEAQSAESVTLEVSVEEDKPAVVVEEQQPAVVVEEPVVVQDLAEKPVEEQPKTVATPEVVTSDTAKPEVPAEPELDADGKPKEPVIIEPVTPVNYEEVWKKISEPIKANGKTYEVKTPEEAIRLMQMGAGFGRKMQDIQPHLKTLRFLDQNGLLNVDQSELAYLVDLRSGNKEAIKKLIKDTGIDPLDFNNEEPVNYQTRIRPVTDDQVAFTDALQDIKGRDGGNEFLQEATAWDAKSHEALMRDPAMLDVLYTQRKTGIYDVITAEIDRQKAIGSIPHTTPFIEAYVQVGNHLRDNNGFDGLAQVEKPAVVPPATVAQPQLIETRVVPPKPSVSNTDKAKAAATTKNAPVKVVPSVNPLALSDEEFAQKYGNRF